MASAEAVSSQMRRSEVIVRHSDFSTARERYVDAMMSLYEGEPFLSRLLLEAGRWFVFRAVVSLQAGFDEHDRSSWPTLRLVQEELQEVGLASPRRVHEIVARLVHTGFVAALPLPRDRRVRILAPTARMVAHDRAAAAALGEALAAVLPSPRAPSPLAPAPDHGAVLRSGRALKDNAPVLFFLEREAGFGVLMTLIRRGRDPRAPLCFTELGGSFGVSRTHVRLVLREAVRLGHLAGSGGCVSVPPATMAGFDRFLAGEMSAVAGPRPGSVPADVATAA